jgi:hypothetical protein
MTTRLLLVLGLVGVLAPAPAWGKAAPGAKPQAAPGAKPKAAHQAVPEAEPVAAGQGGPQAGADALRAAIRDLMQTFGSRYGRGAEFLARLERIEDAAEFAALRREALLANPLVSGQPILFVVRAQYAADHHSTETMFQTGEINTGKFRGPGALKTVDFGRGGEVRTLVEAPRGVARDPEVDFDGRRIIFSMRKDITDDYHLYEVAADGSGLRQLTSGAGVFDIDPACLPAGDIVFVSSREPKYCQCNRHIMGNLFTMGPGGEALRQIGHNILFEGHPSLAPDGRILYDRWEYVDRHFGPSFGLWTVNPDGTGHALFYGNNAWSPGAILDARVIPGTEKVVATFGSCHDRPWGAIAVVDRSRGLDGSDPVERIWPASARGLLPHERTATGFEHAGGIDGFKTVTPKYEDPYPLSDKYFLASRTVKGEEMGLALLDVFGNELLLHGEPPGCFDPMPLGPRPRPQAIPPRVDLAASEGLFYLADVYDGTGMASVARGTIRYLRVVEAPQKLFWCQGHWNIDATQAPAMNWNCTNNKRVLGDVPVEEDGSAYFAVPADRFIYFQALDKDKMMVQSMRSGTTIMPGETQGCVGCHENRLAATAPADRPSAALRRGPSRLEPWYGPPRDFNYLAEVQPVFDRCCVRCHDYGKPGAKKLVLAGDLGLAFNASYVELRSKSAVRWFMDPPGAGKVLVKAVDDGPPDVLPPYAWGSHRSRLVDHLRSGGGDLKVDRESFERIVTWIDLNAPYYGSYATSFGDNAFGRSPLDAKQVARLGELTAVAVGDQKVEMKASQVSFTRPELSPCLAGLKEKDPAKYAEALAIIRAGQETLARVGRADVPGYRLSDVDRARQEKYDALMRAQAAARRAIVAGKAEAAGRP